MLITIISLSVISCSRLICTPVLEPAIFLKSAGSCFMGNGIRDQDLGVRHVAFIVCSSDPFRDNFETYTCNHNMCMQICIHTYSAYRQSIRAHTDIHIHVLEVTSSYQYLQFLLLYPGFFPAFPHSIFTCPFFNGEKPGSHPNTFIDLLSSLIYPEELQNQHSMFNFISPHSVVKLMLLSARLTLSLSILFRGGNFYPALG